jgi:hypothetical protein
MLCTTGDVLESAKNIAMGKRKPEWTLVPKSYRIAKNNRELQVIGGQELLSETPKWSTVI